MLVGPETHDTPEPTTAMEPVNILVVDDRPEQLLALSAILADLRQNVVTAPSGREALRYLLRHDCAAILLDVRMPDMDGFETAALIRQRKKSKQTPIIFVTALFDNDSYISQGYSLGAVDYLHAPVVPEVLKAKIGVFVELFQKTAQVKRLLTRERQRAAQLQKLAKASLAINSQQSIAKMLHVVTEQARQIIGAHQAITRVTGDPNAPKAAQAVSLSDKYVAWHPSHCKADAFYSLIALANQPLRMTQDQLQEHPAWRSARDAHDQWAPIRGWLSAPLGGRDGRIMGFILLSDKYDGEFTEEDEAIIVQLAQLASIAIENTLYSEAREANRLKDEFLATLSHELRTPLNAMLGWSQMLRRGVLNEAATARALAIIERNVKAQAQLVDELLDVSRIATGKLKLKIRPMQLVPVIEAAIDSIHPSADAKDIRIRSQLDPAADRVFADPDRLQQVVWNLLSNAVKFTPRGGCAEVQLTRLDRQVRITVSDTGEGIGPELLPYIFERFRQADSSPTRSHGGLGIGLAVVRHVVELHGGTVRAESAGVSQGAIFTVDLPIIKSCPEPQPPQPPQSAAPRFRSWDGQLDGLNVLVVEDEPDTRDLVVTVLADSGASVRAVGSVREAIEMVRILRPDVLVTDIGMPGEDGYELLNQVRARRSEWGGGDIPAVALTAYVRAEERDRALAAGFQMHLPKPVEPSVLVSVVARVSGRGETVPASTAADSPGS